MPLGPGTQPSNPSLVKRSDLGISEIQMCGDEISIHIAKIQMFHAKFKQMKFCIGKEVPLSP